MGFSIGSVFKEATNVLDNTLAVANTAKSVAEVAGIKTAASESPFGTFASILVDALASQNQNQADLASNEELFPVAVGQALYKSSPALAEDYEEELELLRSDPKSAATSKEIATQAMDNLVAEGEINKQNSEDIIEKALPTESSSTFSYQGFAKNPLTTTSKLGSALLESYTAVTNIKDFLPW